MPTEERIARVTSVLSFRQPDLRVVLEDVTNTHNANAVLRTCDAAGVLNVDVITAGGEPLPINKAITTRADKWLELRYHPTAAACLRELKERGFLVAATDLGPGAVPYDTIDYTGPTAVVFGNEREGLSAAALELADVKIRVPMYGMVQSLNLSVSVGILLYEALRQRASRGRSETSRLAPEELEEYRRKWLDPSRE
jgi:tRNA (guanosine-2'-O-)-methyltransferase